MGNQCCHNRNYLKRFEGDPRRRKRARFESDLSKQGEHKPSKNFRLFFGGNSDSEPDEEFMKCAVPRSIKRCVRNDISSEIGLVPKRKHQSSTRIIRYDLGMHRKGDVSRRNVSKPTELKSSVRTQRTLASTPERGTPNKNSLGMLVEDPE